jgi:hypothetical protein
LYLGNPLLPINITAQSAEESLKKKLTQKNWQEFELKKIELILVPYFLFNYHYFLENSGSGNNTIKSTVHGILAVDGHEITVREDLVELLKLNWKKAVAEVPRGQFEEKWCNIEKKEQEEVLQLTTAENFEVPKQNVVISSARKFFVPFYKTSTKLEGTEYNFIINAIDGTIEGIKTVPEREKGYVEITKETIKELKSPKSWVKYSKEALLQGTSGVFSSKPATKSKDKPSEPKKSSQAKPLDLSWLDSKPIWIMIILLAILLIVIGLFKLRF